MRNRPLSSELELLGCSMPSADFLDLLQEVRAVMFPAWSDDQMLCNPDQSKQFCNVIRAKAGELLIDDLILRSLLNARKNPNKCDGGE